MNKAQNITTLVLSFMTEKNSSGVWDTVGDIGTGLGAGLSVVGKGTSWGLHQGGNLVHGIASATEYTPALTGAAALGGAYALHRRFFAKRDRNVAY